MDGALINSVLYVSPRNGAHYFVELTEKHLLAFEMLNSMCLLENYDHVLLFLECQFGKSHNLAVIPFDIILVLFTLSTLSEYYKEPILRANDPYNTSRETLSRRALKLLQKYLAILKEFDSEQYNLYDLELLRCQFFLAIDTLTPKKQKWSFDRFRRTKSEKGVTYRQNANVDPELDQAKTFKNPYRSYISCLEQRNTILGNRLLNLKLNEPGEFINMILWTLSNSLQESTPLFLSSHEIWMPLLEILIDLFSCRQDYFIQHEVAQNVSKSLFVQRLSESPLAVFFESLNTRNFANRFSEYVFLNCDYKLPSDNYATPVHPVYNGENTIVDTYIPTIKCSPLYKSQKSLALRRKLIGSCFKLLLRVPDGHRLITPRIVADDVIQGISRTLASFNDILQFKKFFMTENLSQESYFIPLLAEGTLSEILKDTQECVVILTLVENLSDGVSFCNEVIGLVKSKCFAFTEQCSQASYEEAVLNIEKCDVCLLVLLRYLLHLIGTEAILDAKEQLEMLHAIEKNDSGRRQWAKALNLGNDPPLLYPIVSQMFGVHDKSVIIE
ncbi:BAP_1a_G0040260.mRNA.1.CDS.1 [Saccharomyces cerevisiae]|nr:BAP_1a_G0040260.mRNA.1.CDS.1 [Saccharomyces cerevisiae]CAI7264250.1 BAP_1a_G0040260.mRNA.1.CDS.1 [Saccharomyces cerevisiae]